ncbi:hypothetical protein Ferpe_1579 [Fervidobacterium pennivorans DSM 9078]|uniref:Photolyase/cryptochrome alpha/beta domain-containing protein n=1 Tax=Fervidobacterium pennivorans (strain DSM 9078 / Ven5) TaxID=771875 RepID=H9UDQ0_FERPD|nr:hypothetical protein Ferpe_1579 [Fervidobacterium pennivorans DSM 9078]
MRTIIVWFENDLRVSDNPLYIMHLNREELFQCLFMQVIM